MGSLAFLYSSRLILLYTNHLEGRQTVENHLVHMIYIRVLLQFPSFFHRL